MIEQPLTRSAGLRSAGLHEEILVEYSRGSSEGTSRQ